MRAAAFVEVLGVELVVLLEVAPVVGSAVLGLADCFVDCGVGVPDLDRDHVHDLVPVHAHVHTLLVQYPNSQST